MSEPAIITLAAIWCVYKLADKWLDQHAPESYGYEQRAVYSETQPTVHEPGMGGEYYDRPNTIGF